MSHGIVTDARVTREELLARRDEPVHVVGGASAEGITVLRLLLGLGFTRMTVHDQRERALLRKAFRTTHGAYSRHEQDELWDELRPVLDAGCFGEQYLEGIESARVVVLGQGWYLEPDNRARLVASIPDAALVVSMVGLYFELHRGPIAAVTGTNGKSTTVELVQHLLRTGGIVHRTAGNERSSRQFLPEVDELPAGTLALLEVSNRQLLQLSTSPRVAAITSLTPDHLEEHDGLEGYRDTKARLFRHQRPDDIAIANADDPQALAVATASAAAEAGRLVRCGIGDLPAPSVSWRDGMLVAAGVPTLAGGRVDEACIATADDLRLPGDHNRRNAAVAIAVAVAVGIDPAQVAAGLRTFEGKALRLQLLDVVGGVEVWSDLKSTTPESTIAALAAIADAPTMLIAGGDDKGLDYAPLARAIVEHDVHVLLVPGSASDSLEAELAALVADRPELLPRRVGGLEEALDLALERAASGERVIVSPAAAGFWTRQLQGATSLRSLVRRRATALTEVSDR